LNAQIWRKEGTAWKLVRDGSVSEELTDQLLALAPDARAAFLEENKQDLPAIRYTLAQRASLAAMQRSFGQARDLFTIALDIARAVNDRRGESEALNNIATAYYNIGNLD